MTINNDDNAFFSDIKSDGLDTSNISGISRPMSYDSDISKSYSSKLWIILFIIVLLGIAIILFLPRKSRLKTSADIPNIQAPTENMKTEHEMPKPSEVLQNVTIYDRDDQKQKSSNNLSQDFKTMGIDNSTQNKNEEVNIYNKNKPSLLKPVTEKNIKTSVVKKPSHSNTINTKKKVKEEKNKTLPMSKNINSKPTLIETKTSVAGEVELSYATSKKDTNRKKGAWSVQIVSAISEAAADNAWSKLIRKYPKILDGLDHKVFKTEIAGKTFYRLRIVNLPDAKTATQICSLLKADGESCFVAR